MGKKGMTPLSEDEKSTQVLFKIAPQDLKMLDVAADNMGVSRSKFIRMSVLARVDSPTQQLTKIDNKIKELELELSVKKLHRQELFKKIELKKATASNREDAIITEINKLILSLKANGGRVENIKIFIINSASTINKNYNGSAPITADELIKRLVDRAGTQGVKCRA